MTLKVADKNVFEILDEFHNAGTRISKTEVLHEHKGHKPLYYILKWNFDEKLKSTIPPGTPPFNKEPQDGPSISNLWNYLKHFPMFVESSVSAKMHPTKRERLFIEMLEAVEIQEAEVICLAKDGKLENSKWKGLTPALVSSAWPELDITNKALAEPEPEISSEDKITELLARADELKAKSKDFNVEAKKLVEEAKKLA